MKCRRLPCLVLVGFVCNLWIFSTVSRVECFSSPSLSQNDRRISKVKQDATKTEKYDRGGSEKKSSSNAKSTMAPMLVNDNRRREFVKLATSTAVALVGGLAAPMPSYAADSAATVTATGGVKVSKRAGGLAQKIRGGVCFKMVRKHDLDLWTLR